MGYLDETGLSRFLSDFKGWIASSDSNLVHQTGAESIAGAKDFTGTVTINGLEVVPVQNSAAAHNSLYRGKDLTSVYTLDQIHAKLADGDFSDLYIGDYITKPVDINISETLDGETITASFSGNMNFRFAHFDYWLGLGDTEFTTHHIIVVPDLPFFNMRMRATSTTAGGIPATNVWSVLQNAVYTALNSSSCMDGRILTHRDWIPNSVNATAASSAGAGLVGSTIYNTTSMWRSVNLGLLHETMVYSGNPFSSSGYDMGCGKTQLALFRLDQPRISIRRNYWLCAVSSSSQFSYVDTAGYARCHVASLDFGVRPYFIIG